MSTKVTLLLGPDDRVTCPHCEQEFSLEQGFARHALESLEANSNAELERQREAARQVAERRAQQVEAQRGQQAQQQLRLQLEALQKQYSDSQQQLTHMRNAELKLRVEQQKLKDRAESLELEIRRQVDAQLSARETAVRTQEQQRSALQHAELQKKLDDLTERLADAQRKAEQGSQQLQGEVLEIALEDGLRRAFPLDAIEEVKKGQRGGDVIHRVTARSGAAAGVLLWETKRAQVWNAQWLTKLREDMRACGADAGVLVITSNAAPREWSAGTQFAIVDDTWVVTWPLALQLGEALRAGLLDVHKQRVASAGKDEKMEAVYDYVTSPQFAQKLKAVFAAFARMHEELESEKSQTLQRWSRREKQLAAGRMALLGVGGDLQGLAQQDLPQLELEPDQDSRA